ncbi:RNA polymerase sigma factor [Streptomyces sp. NBC_01178]|uniref:RNA polymerase sigma factor n=1 Tax=Streptomyces sp. NBC_01178 TaxID=2903762 RepID=UPI00386B5DF8|nr:RNA polymerase sigma factor [Streptomyces sp. NBC_01178]
MLGDDAELTAAVLAAQDGDEDAFRAVYRAVQPRLLGYIRTLVGDSDAEDVASEAWLQIARDLDRFSGDADRFRGWTARIARNRSLDHLRMRSRRPAIGGDETELTTRAAESDTADDAIEALDTDRTMSLIAQLPQDQAEAVVLRVVVGLDAKSAAQALGKRPGAVRTAAHRGLKRLAELLGAEQPGRAAGRADAGAVPPADRSDAAPDAAPDAGPSDAGAGPAEGASGPVRSADDADRETGGGAGLGAVPAQRPGRVGPAAPAGITPGVTHLRPWTQKDM